MPRVRPKAGSMLLRPVMSRGGGIRIACGSRYSVPVAFVGCTVTVRELLSTYEILHQGRVIARHARGARHRVVMEREHYADLLRPRGAAQVYRLSPAPPRHDPRYPASADVSVRDLAVYAAIAEGGES